AGMMILLTHEDLVGQVFGLDLIGCTEDYRVLNRILQFANIAWPIIDLQIGKGFSGNIPDKPFAFLAGPTEKMMGKQRYVIPTLAQRGHRDGDNIQTVI